MKLFLINYEFPPLGGGAGNATKCIARELVSLGHEVVVMATWFTDLAREEIWEGVRIVRIPSGRKQLDRSSIFEMIRFVLQGKKKAREIVEQFRPDHIISFFAVPTGIIAHDLYKKYNIPYTVSLRGGDVPGFLPKELWLMHMVSYPITRYVWNDAHAIVANSHELVTLAEKTAHKISKTVECIPNGVDTLFFIPGTPHHDECNILCVGRLVSQKRFDTVIVACARILNSDSKRRIRLSIVGDGPLRSTLSGMVEKLGIGKHVVFHGWLDKDALLKCYQSAHIFILPSIEEGMPNVILEALACAVPVIATRVSGNEELLEGGAGILIDTTDEIEHAICSIMNNSEFASVLRDKALRRGQEFTWKTSASAYVQLML